MAGFFSQSIDTTEVKSVMLQLIVGSLVHPIEFSPLQLLLATRSNSYTANQSFISAIIIF